jgi:hypothetical protein
MGSATSCAGANQNRATWAIPRNPIRVIDSVAISWSNESVSMSHSFTVDSDILIWQSFNFDQRMSAWCSANRHFTH